MRTWNGLDEVSSRSFESRNFACVISPLTLEGNTNFTVRTSRGVGVLSCSFRAVRTVIRCDRCQHCGPIQSALLSAPLLLRPSLLLHYRHDCAAVSTAAFISESSWEPGIAAWKASGVFISSFGEGRAAAAVRVTYHHRARLPCFSCRCNPDTPPYASAPGCFVGWIMDHASWIMDDGAL